MVNSPGGHLMARIRSIHPQACTSEKLARASAEAERCYWRLQTHCDDEGRAEDHPRLVWAALFPLHENVGPDDVDRWLDELHAAALIVRYEVEGKRYLSVNAWDDFQHPQRPKRSTIPAPSGTRTRHVRDDSATPTTDLVPVDIHVLPGEGEGEGDEAGGGAIAIAARSRAADPVWEAILECWQIDPAELTDTERARLNKATKLLRDVDADPNDIPRRRAIYRARYRDAADTPMAIAGRWSELRQQSTGETPKLPAGSDMTARNLARLEGAL